MYFQTQIWNREILQASRNISTGKLEGYVKRSKGLDEKEGQLLMEGHPGTLSYVSNFVIVPAFLAISSRDLNPEALAILSAILTAVVLAAFGQEL